MVGCGRLSTFQVRPLWSGWAVMVTRRQFGSWSPVATAVVSPGPTGSVGSGCSPGLIVSKMPRQHPQRRHQEPCACSCRTGPAAPALPHSPLPDAPLQTDDVPHARACRPAPRAQTLQRQLRNLRFAIASGTPVLARSALSLTRHAPDHIAHVVRYQHGAVGADRYPYRPSIGHPLVRCEETR